MPCLAFLIKLSSGNMFLSKLPGQRLLQEVRVGVGVHQNAMKASSLD